MDDAALRGRFFHLPFPFTIHYSPFIMSLDIKICGMKTDEALAAALDGGATHVGFIFFARSPRNVSPREAGRLRQAARGRALAVAVTVDADDAALAEIVAAMQPDMLQLHGHESPLRVAEVRESFGLPVIKALSVREAADLDAVGAYLGIADRMLLDAKPPAGAVLPGGNGVSFDWTLLSDLPSDADYFLSGGLDAGSVAEAIRIVGPNGVDVSSGVESAPGVKNPALIRAFLAAARAATA
jgi:phosphoribosylanthranilate isomerase